MEIRVIIFEGSVACEREWTGRWVWVEKVTVLTAVKVSGILLREWVGLVEGPRRGCWGNAWEESSPSKGDLDVLQWEGRR